MSAESTVNSRRWLLAALVVGGVVAGAQLALVKVAGTDIPFLDQWNAEGAVLYPRWLDGSLSWTDLFAAHNEHRIVWTRLLGLALFVANGGQWDPLLQLAAGALLHGGVAALLVWCFRRSGSALVVTLAALLSLPFGGWHNALWGFQSQVYFAVGFALLALANLAPAGRTPAQTLGGLLAGVAGLGAMAPASLVPAALLGLALLRAIGQRQGTRAFWRESWPAWTLLMLALWLRPAAAGNFVAPSPEAWLTAAGRMLAWPHTGSPVAAVALNIPLLWLGVVWIRRRGANDAAADFILAAGGWTIAVALAGAWARGMNEELSAGVPSRYADVLLVLPLANAAAGLMLARERFRGRLAVGLWTVFLLLGWLGLAVEVTRGVILPRARDRDAPVRLARQYQLTRDPAVIAGQPRLLVPHTDPAAVSAVLDDPRWRGHLPPSFQPGQPPGALSRGVRLVLGGEEQPRAN